METQETITETFEDQGDWLYCEDEGQTKYVLYRGHPAFLVKFTGKDRCIIEGMDSRFSFSDPLCRDLIEVAERKGRDRFGVVNTLIL